MDYLITFLEGVVTFVSPCLLPMLPIYLAYFAGGVRGDGDEGGSGSLRHTVVCALGFVLGFGVIFTLLGAFAGSVGALLLRHQAAVNVACGLLMVVLGLNYLGILRVDLLQRTARLQTRVAPRGFVTSLAFGMVFAIGWSPCVGTFLASALSLAATSASMVRGVGLLAAFSLGLGLPFVLAAVLVDQLEGAFAWIKRHYLVVNRVCGAFLVLVGVLMATGMLGTWLAAFPR